MKTATGSLKARRKAAYAMNALCREAELGTLAIKFDADQDKDWLVIDDYHVRALSGGKHVADVELAESIALLSILNPMMLIRPKHASEVNLMDHGFAPARYDGMGDPIAIVITIGIPEDIPMLNAPARMPMPRMPRHRPVKVKRRMK